MRQSFQYETEKKEQEIELLNATSERNAAQRNLFIGLTLGFVLLLASGAYFMIRIRRQNQVIELALEEKIVLLKEIHHRVKNNLQMISSLLGLQSRYTSDETASRALKESQGRVTSVSLIHQRLYSETNLTGVFMREYVQELTEELLYSANADDMDVHLDIDDLNLDIDTVIPLGLILNELITNAIKYGRRESGTLNVLLKEENSILSLIVSDRGLGFPPDFDPKITNSYGMKLIRSLSDKLKAETSFNNLKDGGAQIQINICKYKHAA